MGFREETTEEKAKRILAEIVKDKGVTTNDQMNFLTLHCRLFSFKMFKRRFKNDKV